MWLYITRTALAAQVERTNQVKFATMTVTLVLLLKLGLGLGLEIRLAKFNLVRSFYLIHISYHCLRPHDTNA